MKAKMKYIIIISSFFLLSSISHAQTKEETLEWLNNNLNILLPTTHCNGINGKETAIDNFKIENDSLIFKEEWQGTRDYSVAIKDILYMESNINDFSDKPSFESCPENVYFYFKSKKDKVIITTTFKTGNKSKDLRDIFLMPYKKENKDNAMRVVKAIMHLAKLSGATQNKQTF